MEKYLLTESFELFFWIHFQQFLRKIKHFIIKDDKSIDIINIKEAFKKEIMNKSMKEIDNDSEMNDEWNWQYWWNWIINKNDSIGEIELWMNMTELIKMNYEFTFMKVNNYYDWQIKCIKKLRV